MNNSEILEIISGGENSAVEFKEADLKAENLSNEITALANTYGGLIFIGVNDSGETTGLNPNFNYEEWSMNIARNNIVPSANINYEEYILEEKKIAIINVAKGKDRPYQTNKGKYLVRIGSTNRQATQNELMRLFQQAGLFHYDLTAVDRTSLKDVNLTIADNYFNRYDIDFVNEDQKERIKLLQNTDILTADNKLTVAGLLIFGINPQRYLYNASVSFVHFAGNEISDKLIDKQVVDGVLPNQIDRTVSLIKNNIQKKSVIEHTKRKNIGFIYNDFVFKELITNACVHRNYSISGSSIRVFMFDNRIEFISPGRLPNTVTIEKLKAGVSFSINHVIVKFLENMRYIDKIGRGLPMVYNQAVNNNKDIQFKELGEEFKVVLEL
jgi:ATP-dependent DNA helicase RecG